MRKVIVLEHISLDGVIQAPGGYQRWLRVWRVDSAIFRPDAWNGPEKADEPAVRPVVRA
jgi:hypothetical protein